MWADLQREYSRNPVPQAVASSVGPRFDPHCPESGLNLIKRFIGHLKGFGDKSPKLYNALLRYSKLPNTTLIHVCTYVEVTPFIGKEFGVDRSPALISQLVKEFTPDVPDLTYDRLMRRASEALYAFPEIESAYFSIPSTYLDVRFKRKTRDTKVYITVRTQVDFCNEVRIMPCSLNNYYSHERACSEAAWFTQVMSSLLKSYPQAKSSFTIGTASPDWFKREYIIGGSVEPHPEQIDEVYNQVEELMVGT